MEGRKLGGGVLLSHLTASNIAAYSAYDGSTHSPCGSLYHATHPLSKPEMVKAHRRPYLRDT